MLNDKDMDVLIGRYAKGAAKGTPVEHPDADELNAFAEGALPPLARQRYLSHFADCDDCRKLVTQLAVTAGAGVEARIPASQPVAEPWWKKLGAVFAIPTLRYAALACVVLAVGGIAFLTWRQPPQRDSQMVAQNQPQQTSPVEAVKPALTQEPEARREDETQRYVNPAIPQPTVSSTSETSDQSKSGLTTLSPPPPPKPADALAAKDAPVVAGAGRSDDARAQSTPSYAPAPAETYRMESRERAQQSPGAIPGGPRRNESSDKYKIDSAKSGDFARARDEDSNRASANQPAPENKQEASKSARPTSEVAVASRRRVGESRVEARKSEGSRSTSEEAEQTRSVGGRKFKRQGNAWVDSKLKSSMSVRTVGRGSEDFDKLDSGLRAIANQLSGEIVVVWKGKAYRIK